MLTVYQYPKCETCRRALRWLSAQQIPFKSIDVTLAPPSVAQLKQAQRDSGLALRKLFNTSGRSYREGGFRERLPTMTEPQALAALAADGKLVKRPLIIGEGLALVGFNEAAYRAALLGS